MKTTNKAIPNKGRNAVAMSACFMKAGIIPHRNAARGGSSNDMSNYMDEYLEDQYDTFEISQDDSNQKL